MEANVEFFVHYEDMMSETINKTFSLTEEDIQSLKQSSDIQKTLEELKYKYIPNVSDEEYRKFQDREDIAAIENAQAIYGMHNFFSHSLFSEFEHLHFYNGEHSEGGHPGEYVVSFYKESGEWGDQVLHITLKSDKREVFPEVVSHYLVASEEERRREDEAYDYDPWDFDWSDPFRSDSNI